MFFLQSARHPERYSLSCLDKILSCYHLVITCILFAHICCNMSRACIWFGIGTWLQFSSNLLPLLRQSPCKLLFTSYHHFGIGFAHLLEEFSSQVVLLQEPLRKILFPPLLAYKEYLNFSIIWNTWQRYWVTSASRLPCVRDCSCAPAADGSHDGSVFNCSLTGLGGRTLSYRGLRGWPKERAVVFIQIDPL